MDKTVSYITNIGIRYDIYSLLNTIRIRHFLNSIRPDERVEDYDLRWMRRAADKTQLEKLDVLSADDPDKVMGITTPSVKPQASSGSFEVLTLAMTLGNGSRTHFGASQCIPIGPCHLTHRLTLHLPLGVVIA